MDESCCLKGLSWFLTRQALGCELAQLGIDQGQQVRGRLEVPGCRGMQHRGEVAHGSTAYPIRCPASRRYWRFRCLCQFLSPLCCFRGPAGRFVEIDELLQEFGQADLSLGRNLGFTLFHPLVTMLQEWSSFRILLLTKERSAQQGL